MVHILFNVMIYLLDERDERNKNDSIALFVLHVLCLNGILLLALMFVLILFFMFYLFIYLFIFIYWFHPMCAAI